MIGRLDPEENVMDDSLIAKRKATAICNQGVREKLLEAISKLGWDCYDNVAVEIAGTSVYEIGGAGTKWAPVKGTVGLRSRFLITMKASLLYLTVPFTGAHLVPAPSIS